MAFVYGTDGGTAFRAGPDETKYGAAAWATQAAVALWGSKGGSTEARPLESDGLGICEGLVLSLPFFFLHSFSPRHLTNIPQ